VEDKYKNDKYDRELYIPKGYILPDGTMLTKNYSRFHRYMAEKFIMENYYTSYKNDFIKDEKDYMLMRLGTLQVTSCSMPYTLRYLLLTRTRYTDDGFTGYCIEDIIELN